MFWASKALREKVKKQLKNEQDLEEKELDKIKEKKTLLILRNDLNDLISLFIT